MSFGSAHTRICHYSSRIHRKGTTNTSSTVSKLSKNCKDNITSHTLQHKNRPLGMSPDALTPKNRSPPTSVRNRQDARQKVSHFTFFCALHSPSRGGGVQHLPDPYNSKEKDIVIHTAQTCLATL